MAISTTSTWSINQCTRDTSDGFILDANATLTGVAKSDSVGIATYGYSTTVEFGTVRPDPMIPYADVTEANVISWVQTGLGTTQVSIMESNINNGLKSIYAPSTPETSTGIPW